jgi:outer membrane protein assembly factor BamB
MPSARLLAAVLGAVLAASVPASTAPFAALHGLPPDQVSPFPGAWYGFRNGYQNQGRAPVAARALFATPSSRPLWKHETGGLIWGTPILDGQGNVYVGSADKVFYALSPAGAVRWTYTLPDAGDSLIDSAATLTPGGLVVVPGGDGTLYALHQDSGAVAWTFDAYHAGDHDGGVTVNSFEGNVTLGPDGNLYAGNDNGHFYSLTPDGQERWSFGTGMMIWSAAAFAPDGSWVAFGSLDNRLYVLDTATGEELASFKVAGEIKASPVVDAEGRIYFGAADFSFRCVELVDGFWGGKKLKQVWRYDVAGDLYSSAALADGKVVFGSHDGYLYALTLDGELAWRYGAHARISGSPLVTEDGVVIVGAKDGKLYAIDLEAGTRIWSVKLAPGQRKVNLDSSPAMDQTGRVVLGSYDGHIYTLPVEWPLQNAGDPRVDTDPGPDLPDFGGAVPLDGATLRSLGDDGSLAAEPAGQVAPHAPLTFQVVTHEEGAYVPNAALAASGLAVTVDPPTPVDVVIASDSYRVNLVPKTFWQPDTTYTVTITGRVYHRGNPFVDLIKWWNLTPLSYQAQFTTGPAAPALPPAEVTRRFAIRGLYAIQPEILDTLIPAALDGQAFVASEVFADHARGRAGLVVLPGFPQPDGSVTLRPAPEKAFHLDGDLSGGEIAVAGKLNMAAMGGTIPFTPFRFRGRLTEEGVEDGSFFATANVWQIKGNGGTYTGISWQALDDMADTWLRLQAFGSLQGKRMASEAPPAQVLDSAWSSSKALELTLEVTEPFAGEHLVTVAFWDEAEGRIAASATVVVGGEGATTPAGNLVVGFEGLKRSKLMGLSRAVLFDGVALSQ